MPIRIIRRPAIMTATVEPTSLFRSGATAGSQSEYWILQSSNNAVRYFAWGLRDDQTIQRDYDGDGITDVAVFRRGATANAQTTWYIRESSTGNARVEAFGLTGNGSHRLRHTDSGRLRRRREIRYCGLSFRHSSAQQLYHKRSSDNVITYRNFGNFNSDWIVSGDYDGDGKYDLAVARTGAQPTTPMVWWILQSSTGTTRIQTFGISSDSPAQGDYDGDARTDIAIYRGGATTSSQSFYYVRNSLNGNISITPWGLGGDFSVNTFDTR